MSLTAAHRAFGHRLSVLASVCLVSAGCAGGSAAAPQALPEIAGADVPVVVVTTPNADQPPATRASQLRIVSGVVRTWIHRINVKHERENGRLRILVFTPHIDSPTTADVYVALERGRNESTPLLDREIELRLIRGRWVIIEALPT